MNLPPQQCEPLSGQRAVADPDFFEVAIDCAPGELRPDHYLAQVLRGTGMHVRDFGKPRRFFGAWTWTLRTGEDRLARFLKARLVLGRRLKSLCDRRLIRGAYMSPALDVVFAVPR